MGKQAVIIGAGPAGLTAAYELLKSGFNVTVLESSSTVGGLCRCASFKGNICDLGGHRFFSDNQRVVALWKEFLGEELTERERKSAIYFKNRLFDYPVTERIFSQLGAGLTFKSGVSLLGTVFFKHNEDNLEGYLINRFGKTLYSLFFKEYTHKLWEVQPSEISPDWGRQRINGISLKDAAMLPFSKKKSVPSRFFYPKYGPQQMWESAAKKITAMGGDIRFNCMADKFRVNDGRISSVEYIFEGEKFCAEGDYFVSSMPLRELIMSVESVPKKLRETAEDLSYRNHITVGIIAERLKIKDNDNCWIYIQDPDVKMGRVQFYSNWSPYLSADKDKFWIGAEYFTGENDSGFYLSDDDYILLAAEELVKTGILYSSEDITGGCVERSEKAYPAYWGSYKNIGQLQKYADSFGNLYCIGRNGQHRYNNISHSMLNALEAADNIISGRIDKDNVWSINRDEIIN